MSIELSLTTAERISFEGISVDVAGALRTLLHLAADPHVTMRRASGDGWVVSVAEAAVVHVTAVTIPPHPGVGTERVVATEVDAGLLRTPGSKVLAVAVAIALARRAGTAVVDDARWVTDTVENDPRILLERVRLASPQHDFEAGAREFAASVGRGVRSAGGRAWRG